MKNGWSKQKLTLAGYLQTYQTLRNELDKIRQTLKRKKENVSKRKT